MSKKSIQKEQNYYEDKRKETIVPYVENTKENEVQIKEHLNQNQSAEVHIPFCKRLPIFDFLFIYACCFGMIIQKIILYSIITLYFMHDYYNFGIITASIHAVGLLLSAAVRLDTMTYITPWSSMYYINLVLMIFSLKALVTGCRILRESLNQQEFRDKHSVLFCSEKTSTEMSMLCLTVICFQSGPQIILQIVAHPEIKKIKDKGLSHLFLGYGILYYIFLTVFLIPFAATSALPIRSKMIYKLQTPRFVPTFRSIMKYCAVLCHTMSRTMVFFGIAEVIGWWMAVICGVQWLIMYSFFLILNSHQTWFMYNDSKTLDSVLFKPFIPIFYLFTFAHPYKSYLSFKGELYFLMTILMNLAVLYIIYSINEEDTAFLSYPYKSLCYYLLCLFMYFLIVCLDGVYDLSF